MPPEHQTAMTLQTAQSTRVATPNSGHRPIDLKAPNHRNRAILRRGLFPHKPQADASFLTSIDPIESESYDFIRGLVYDHSGINLGDDKTELVRSRLQKRLRILGLKSFKEYCALLNSSSGADEIPALLDVISTNVTDFFREWSHFEFIRDRVLPEWRSGPEKTGSIFRAWSAACSSGEEPYSLSILLNECLRRESGAGWKIMATDLSTRMLATAERAIYRQERVKLPQSEWLRRYFQQGRGNVAGYYRVKAEVRQTVEFSRLNLMETQYRFPQKFHTIFCRNVMIYFDRKTQEQLVPRLAEQLEPGGYLMVGHSESLVSITHGLKCIKPSIYQKA
jgi:chemotaxis protein methyltransferase CheR